MRDAGRIAACFSRPLILFLLESLSLPTRPLSCSQPLCLPVSMLWGILLCQLPSPPPQRCRVPSIQHHQRAARRLVSVSAFQDTRATLLQGRLVPPAHPTPSALGGCWACVLLMPWPRPCPPRRMIAPVWLGSMATPAPASNVRPIPSARVDLPPPRAQPMRSHQFKAPARTRVIVWQGMVASRTRPAHYAPLALGAGQVWPTYALPTA